MARRKRPSAAALKYNVDSDAAPKVVASGEGVVAEKIIENKHELNVKTVSIAHGTAASEYSTFLKNIKNVIERINLHHQTLDKKLLAQYKCSDIVGKYLKN